MFINPEKLKFNKEEAGFTLVEAIVSLVVLTVALGPVLSLSTAANNIAITIRDNMTAANLAQEGVEVVRSIRDDNWLNGRAFDSGLGNGTYRVEWSSESLIAVGSNPPLKFNELNGQYNYTTGTDTKFRRKIIITKVNSVELKVQSQVDWPVRGGNTKTIIVESHLFDWN